MAHAAPARAGLLIALLSSAPWLAQPVSAQPPAGNPDQMCGDGSTFTVNLPGLAGSLPFGIRATDDSVTLPKGCRMYALLVSGYSVNPRLDHLSFYQLAQFVAANNGYVHYAWWNNLMGEYLSRPLHGGELPATVSHPGGAFTAKLTPGNLLDTHAAGFVPAEIDSPIPKAIPEEDNQFQLDAKRLLEAIRAHNPDALIIVAGHSMGGNAVVRLAASTDTVIDLLAPIDPVGNRNSPRGTPGTKYFNWTRWRVANNLIGYRQLDCVRNALGLCEDFDSRLFHFSYRCIVTPITTTPPLIGTRAPVACPRLEPIVVTGPRPRIGSKVRFLYHRWQKEFLFPFDFGANEILDRGPLTGLLGGNYQAPVLPNALGESDRNKTCGVSGSLNLALVVAQVFTPGFTLPAVGLQPNDPRDPGLVCNPFDGHGEIVGMRNRPGLGLVAQNRWPCYTALMDPEDHCDPDDDSAASRRQKLIEMALAPAPDDDKVVGDAPNWIHEPANPNLDYVVDDMLAIVRHLLVTRPVETDVIAPVTEARVSPDANENGWHMDDVRVDLAASDAGGSGVKEIERSASGATSLPIVVTAGDAVEQIVTAEGATTLTFRARDLAGNVEPAQSLDVRIDRTAPLLSSETDRAPNGNGWFNGPVTVRFVAVDALSGLADSSPDQIVATEGTGQEAIGSATDLAGNQTSATAILNIDTTRPDVAIVVPGDGSVHLLNAPVLAAYSCSDGLSGIDTCIGPVANGAALNTSVPSAHPFSVQAADLAGNARTATVTYSVRYAFKGFLRPQTEDGTATSVNAGQSVPVKYALADASGAAIGDLQSFVSLASAPASCDGGVLGPWEQAAGADPNGIRYDPQTQEFHFNWKTDRRWTGSCRVLRLELNDGSAHVALFWLS